MLKNILPPIQRQSLMSERTVPLTAPAPYQRGDQVEVLVNYPGGNYAWEKAWVFDCTRPQGSRRFVLTIFRGWSIHDAYKNHRVYCWADGTGEEVRPSRIFGGK